MSDLLTLEGINVSYGNIRALKDVNMKVGEGRIVSLIGANGAGKSTLLKAIVGLEPLVSGKVTFNGEVLSERLDNGGKDKGKSVSTNLIASRGIALVPEGRHVFTELTVEENLDMGAFLVRDKLEIIRKKEEMYNFFPILGERKKQRTSSLSGGEQQMMAIARALMMTPKLLLLDEPGLGLAPLIVQDIFNKISIINKEDKVTIFLVEQNARMALKASDEGYVMENGRIVVEDTGKNLLLNPKVKAAYLGE